MTGLIFKPNSRDRLFYDQWEYCLGFSLDEVNALRELDHDRIDRILRHRRQWREQVSKRWASGVMGHAGIMRTPQKVITSEVVANLHKFCDLLLTTEYKFKLVLSTTTAWIYTNDVDFLLELDQIEYLKHKHYTQAVVARPKNTITLKNPKNRYRSYLKHIKLTSEEKQQLCSFLTNQADTIRISPAMRRWTEQLYHRTQDYFFIDYDTESWLVLLSLVHPGLIRKTMELIPAK